MGEEDIIYSRVFNIDDELMRVSASNYNLRIDLDEIDFENKMFKLQNDILQEDIKDLETKLTVQKFKIKSIEKINEELVTRNRILNLLIEQIMKKYEKLLNKTYKNE